MGESDTLRNHYGDSNSGSRQRQKSMPASQRQQQGMMRIVEVEGGHIVRSMGRKDRHSKVCTAKGPRDRRVRLSAPTAIKFYDVQDRLGYDRPSKAVDWLIKNAKPAIDELDELPPWRPSSSPAAAAEDENHSAYCHHKKAAPRNDAGKRPAEDDHVVAGYGFHSLSHHHRHQQQHDDHHHTSACLGGNSSLLPPSLDSDVIADTIKSFFPIAPLPPQTPSASASPCVHLEGCPNDLFARSGGQLQDLRLSLHSYQASNHALPSAEQVLFAGAAALPFDASAMAWQDQHPPEMGRSHGAVAWNAAAEAVGSSGGGGGYFFEAATPAPIGHAPIFTQRGPLQSSNSPAIRAWTDLPPFAADHQITSAAFHPSPSSIPAIGFASGGFSGFCIPARIQGEDEHDAGGDTKPLSTSSAPRH